MLRYPTCCEACWAHHCSKSLCSCILAFSRRCWMCSISDFSSFSCPYSCLKLRRRYRWMGHLTPGTQCSSTKWFAELISSCWCAMCSPLGTHLWPVPPSSLCQNVFLSAGQRSEREARALLTWLSLSRCLSSAPPLWSQDPPVQSHQSALKVKGKCKETRVSSILPFIKNRQTDYNYTRYHHHMVLSPALFQ